MAENIDFSNEVVKFIQETVHKDGKWMAMFVKAAYEKWGREVIDVMCKAFYEFGMKEAVQYKKEAGYEGREDELDVKTIMEDIYSDVFKHLRIAGFEKKVKTFNAKESDITFSRCPILDAWKSVWDKPWFMCEIAKCYDEGFMKGINPKLEWTHYAEKDGQEGLARGKVYEKMRLILKE
jgi:hypothetical protein